uniref:Secreted protein n=1 Tax=Globodera pallida TaxID=36090 RepID=A0A183C294_GLOPA
MLLPILFLFVSTIFVFNSAYARKKSENLEIFPNSAYYNPNKLFAELLEMAHSLSVGGGKAAEERALAKGCQIIQKLHGNPEYPKVVAEHSEFARLLQSVAKVCNKRDNNSKSQLIETFAKNGPPILAQLKLKEQQLLQQNANKHFELLEIGDLVTKLCLNGLPEGYWKSALKELLGEKVHLLPSDLAEFLINKMHSIAIDERIWDKKTEAKLTQEQLDSPKAYHHRQKVQIVPNWCLN